MISEWEEQKNNLQDLEDRLKHLSHSSEALQIIRDFSSSLKNTKARQRLFNQTGALIQAPIFYEDVGANGTTDNRFTLLQGDIVQTDSAYLLGERIEDSKFIVASSTCDLVQDRRQYSALCRIQPLRKADPNIRQLLGELLAFKSTQRMYLPPLPEDPQDVVGNAILLDGIIQIKQPDLLLSRRCASLTLLGWRILGSLLRDLLVRTSESEVAMRVKMTNAKST